jgi:hypothetical protein
MEEGILRRKEQKESPRDTLNMANSSIVLHSWGNTGTVMEERAVPGE